MRWWRRDWHMTWRRWRSHPWQRSRWRRDGSIETRDQLLLFSKWHWFVVIQFRLFTSANNIIWSLVFLFFNCSIRFFIKAKFFVKLAKIYLRKICKNLFFIDILLIEVFLEISDLIEHLDFDVCNLGLDLLRAPVILPVWAVGLEERLLALLDWLWWLYDSKLFHRFKSICFFGWLPKVLG